MEEATLRLGQPYQLEDSITQNTTCKSFPYHCSTTRVRVKQHTKHSTTLHIALTSSLMKDKHLNQTQQIGQFIQRIGNHNYNNNVMVETSSD